MKKLLFLALTLAPTLLLQAQNNPQVFYGGFGDGFSVGIYSQATNGTLYKGGIGDGYATNLYVQSTTNTYKGGLGDGYVSAGYNQPTNPTFARGGIGDGWAAVALLLTPVPVDLVNFSGQKIPEGHLLHWVTANEEHITGYELQRAPDARSFTSLNTQAAVANGTATQSNYQYLDRNPIVGNNFYRVAIKEADGHTAYSNTVLLKVDAKGNTLTIFPNPTATVLHVTINGAISNASVPIQILDVTGKTVLKQSGQANSKTNSINVSTLAAGNYLLMVEIDGKTDAIKFIKQ